MTNSSLERLHEMKSNLRDIFIDLNELSDAEGFFLEDKKTELKWGIIAIIMPTNCDGKGVIENE